MQIEDNIRSNNIKEPVKVRVRKNRFGKSIHSILDGSFLTKDKALRFMPFLLFLSVLGIAYIANIYYAEKTIRQIEAVKRELKELNYDWTNTKSKLSNKRMQSEVAKRLEKKGIKQLTIPPSKIIIPKEQN